MSKLETERLIIRRFSSEDWSDLFEYLSNEEVVKYEPYNAFSVEECKTAAIKRSKNNAFWAVCLKENHKLIGNLYFQQQEPDDFKTWGIGYVFNPKFCGQGYATEASRRLLKYGFEEMGAHRIIAKCNQNNISSWKLLERLSMRRESDYKKSAFFEKTKEGIPIWFDVFQYAILKEEWTSL